MRDVDNDVELPNDIVVGCRLSSIGLFSQCHISKVILKFGQFSVEFSSGDTILGVVNGLHTKDNQTFKVTGLQSFFAGFLVLGNSKAVKQADQVYTFTSTTGAIEESLVTVYDPPTVSKLLHNGASLAGEIKLELTNMDATVNNDSIAFTIVNNLNITSRQDFTAELLTCKNPVIGAINNVEPKKDQSGSNNIDIIGIEPVTITVSAGIVEIGSGVVTLESICKPVVIPPVDATDTYFTDLRTTVDPEWKQWPDYN